MLTNTNTDSNTNITVANKSYTASGFIGRSLMYHREESSLSEHVNDQHESKGMHKMCTGTDHSPAAMVGLTQVR